MGDLRRLIEQNINEMPLAAIQDPGQDPHDPRGDGDYDEDAMIAQPHVKKYFKSKQFHDKAIKAYYTLSVPVYVVPVWTSQYGDPLSRTTEILESEQLEYLTTRGISPDRAQQLSDALKRGSAVFVVKVAKLVSGNLPTPWMIVHAMFDQDGVWAMTEYVDRVIANLQEAFPDEVGYKRVLTMASARNNQILNNTDAASEIMCQAILTSSGFTYNSTKNTHVNNTLDEIAYIVKDARSAFEAYIKGKMISISVFQEV